ncbi:MAG: endonuclease/exonuclease/phosphatase family protein [Ardenticatenales bacterium]
MPHRPTALSGALAAALAQAAVGAAALATFAGLFGRWLPLLDLASHFRMYGLLTLTPGLALAVRRRQLAWTVAIGVPWLISAYSVARLWAPPLAARSAAVLAEPNAADDAPDPGPGSIATDGLRIVVFNVWGVNPTPERIAPYLAASDADVAVLIELRPPLAARLAADPGWPFDAITTAPRDDFFGVGVYVRRDAASRGLRVTDAITDVLRPDDERQRPYARATLHWAGRSATLVAAHPPPPMGAAMTRERDAALAAASSILAGAGRPGILCGDINATPWSTGRRAARSAAPLVDATLGHGYLGTWPAPLGRFLGIPIDVCLIDPSLASVAASVGPVLGSDHRPLHVTLRWR